MIRGYAPFRDHVTAVQERQRGRQQVLLGVEHADPERCQHLVKGERQEIHVQVLHIGERSRHQLSAVDPTIAIRPGQS